MRWVAGAVFAAGILVAAAIGFDDVELSLYQLRFARFLATLGGGIAVVLGALRYFLERQRELAWEKTKFMVELFREFEREMPLRRAQRLVDNARATGDESYLKAILGTLSNLTQEERNDRDAVDRYLDFFDHLYTYVFSTRTLSPDDVLSFSGYVTDILDVRAVSDFALEWGYDDVLDLALHFARRAAHRRRAELAKRLRDDVADYREGRVS